MASHFEILSECQTRFGERNLDFKITQTRWYKQGNSNYYQLLTENRC
jgi:hypothetical protein